MIGRKRQRKNTIKRAGWNVRTAEKGRQLELLGPAGRTRRIDAVTSPRAYRDAWEAVRKDQ